MATKAQADLRATQSAGDASGYKPDLPADLKLPPGIEVKIDTADPSYRDLAAFAHAAVGRRAISPQPSAFLPAVRRARPRRSLRRNVRRSKNSVQMEPAE